jgi:hypothetical protein
MIGRRFTMRAHLERDTAVGAGHWGQAPEPVFEPCAVLPCFAWSPTVRESQDGNKLASVEDVRLLVALGSDVRDRDEVSAITRGGFVLFDGRFRVEGAPQFKHNHLEVSLKRVS